MFYFFSKLKLQNLKGQKSSSIGEVPKVSCWFNLCLKWSCFFLFSCVVLVVFFCYYYLLPWPSWLFFWWCVCGGGNHNDDGCGNGHGKGGYGHNDGSCHYVIHYFSPSFATLHNLGCVFCLLLFMALVIFLCVMFCSLGCGFLLLLLVALIVFFVALVVFFSWPWSYSLVVALHSLGLVIFLMLFFMVCSCFSFVPLGGLGNVFPTLLFGALVMFFAYYSLWPWVMFFCCCFELSFIAIICGLGCVFFLLILVMLFYYCFWLCSSVVFIGHVFLLLPWLWFFTTIFDGLCHVLLMFLFLDLALLNEFSRGIHGWGDKFSKANNVLNKGSTRNRLLCFYFWFKNLYNINNTKAQPC